MQAKPSAHQSRQHTRLSMFHKGLPELGHALVGGELAQVAADLGRRTVGQAARHLGKAAAVGHQGVEGIFGLVAQGVDGGGGCDGKQNVVGLNHIALAQGVSVLRVIAFAFSHARLRRLHIVLQHRFKQGFIVTGLNAEFGGALAQTIQHDFGLHVGCGNWGVHLSLLRS